MNTNSTYQPLTKNDIESLLELLKPEIKIYVISNDNFFEVSNNIYFMYNEVVLCDEITKDAILNCNEFKVEILNEEQYKKYIAEKYDKCISIRLE